MTAVIEPTSAPAGPAAGTAGALSALTGPAAGELLAAAVDLAAGEVLSWRAVQVDHQPGRRVTVGYRVRIRWPDGRESDERLAATTGRAAPDALVLAAGTTEVSVWRYPYDPHLPGLTAAADPTAVAALLAELGVVRVRPDALRLRLRAYRPRRRAVVEVTGPDHRSRLFLKVVPPTEVRSLHRRHRQLADAGLPVPASLGHTAGGLVALVALPGLTLRGALQVGQPVVPGGEAVVDLLDRLPTGLADGPPRKSWLARADRYAEVIAAAVPPAADRVRELAAALVAEAGSGPTVPVHGDFYEKQLLVHRDRITGLLDVDTAGAGDRLDDLGCLLGHLSVLGLVERKRAAETDRLGSGYLRAFERTVDPADLRYRVAAVVLSLATGPHRVQQPGWAAATLDRLALAERWLRSARRCTGRG